MTVLAKRIVTNEDTCSNGILSTNMMTEWLNSTVHTYYKLNSQSIKKSKSRMESIELNAPVFLDDVISFSCNKSSGQSEDVLIVNVIRNNSIIVKSVYKTVH